MMVPHSMRLQQRFYDMSSKQSNENSSLGNFKIVEPTLLDYQDALELQMQMFEQVKSKEISGAFILLEHTPVITLGAGAKDENLLVSNKFLAAQGIKLIKTDRGGDATYHGPGQLVGYPIVLLKAFGSDVHGFLRLIEDVIISALADFGLIGRRNQSAGVWIDDKKVCSIGIAVRSGITYHGFALNVNPNLAHFRFINPCGLKAEQITSMAEALGNSPTMTDVRECVKKHFINKFLVNKK
mgnify:CR=1 FL=1